MENNMPQKLSELVDSVELLDVWLKKSECHCEKFPLGIDVSKIKLLTEYDLKFSTSHDSNFLICFIACKATGNIESDRCFYFHNQFALIYKLKNIKTEILDKVIEEFMNTIALFSAYPYHREQIHGQSIKMGLPSIVIPLVKRIPLLTPEEKINKKI